jgi:hypothetical protein
MHQQKGRFHASPGLRVFLVASPFTGGSLLSGFGNGPGAVRFQELPRIVLNFGGIHGVILLVR